MARRPKIVLREAEHGHSGPIRKSKRFETNLRYQPWATSSISSCAASITHSGSFETKSFGH